MDARPRCVRPSFPDRNTRPHGAPIAPRRTRPESQGLLAEQRKLVPPRHIETAAPALARLLPRPERVAAYRTTVRGLSVGSCSLGAWPSAQHPSKVIARRAVPPTAPRAAASPRTGPTPTARPRGTRPAEECRTAAGRPVAGGAGGGGGGGAGGGGGGGGGLGGGGGVGA